MAHTQPKQPFDPDGESYELVPVTFAANMAEAEFYQTLLADADIEAHIDTEANEQSAQPGKGIAILVSAGLLDDASEVITTREEMEAHILAGPDGRDINEDEDEDDLIAPHQDDDTIVDDEDIFFHRDPFAGEDIY